MSSVKALKRKSVPRRKTMQTVRVTAELIPEEEGGFTVYCPELDIYTQGETEQECLVNLREAAELHLEEIGSPAVVRQVIHREIEVHVGGFPISFTSGRVFLW